MYLLAIDKSIDILNGISDYCFANDIDCEVTNEGQRGLSLIQERDYEVILLDMLMPYYNGFDILKQLKNNGVRDKNIVVITASDLTVSDFQDYKEVGIRKILNKPFKLSDLDQVIKRYDNVINESSF